MSLLRPQSPLVPSLTGSDVADVNYKQDLCTQDDTSLVETRWWAVEVGWGEVGARETGALTPRRTPLQQPILN